MDLFRLSLSSLYTLRGLTIEDDLALLEVATGVFVNEDERKVVASRVLLVHLAEGWGEVEAAEEETDGDCLAAGGRAVHNLERLARLFGRRGIRGRHTSKRTSVSLSLYWFGGTPVVSRRMMLSSMCFIFSLTSKK